jgi:hypothetical protein
VKSTFLTTAVDVFSLGLLAYFCAAGMRPYADVEIVGLARHVGDGGNIPAFPEDAADGSRGAAWAEIVRVAVRCLAHRPEDRPTAKDAVRALKRATKLGDAPA